MRIGPTMSGITGDLERHDVRHVCPECGGQLTSQAGALILVESCWACGGTGWFDDEGLRIYLRRAEHRALQGIR